MEVLITGAGGFIGKYLCKKLSNVHKVTAISRSNQDIENVECFNFDITDEQKVEEVFKTHSFGAVFHLAATTFHDDIVNHKKRTLETGLKGTQNVVTCFNKYCNSAKFIYSSTGKVYGGGSAQPINEQMPAEPKNALGKSKFITERMIEYYSDDNITNKFIILRIFNVYGKGQRDSFVIPHIINSMNLEKIKLGNIQDKRDYINIVDLIDLMENILKTDIEKLKNYDIFNVGSKSANSVKDILSYIENITNRKLLIEIDSERLRNDETDIEYSDFQKAKEVFNWQPKISLEEGLRQILLG